MAVVPMESGGGFVLLGNVGMFDPLQAGGVQFRQAPALAPETVAVIEEQVRRRVLPWFSRRGLLDPDVTSSAKRSSPGIIVSR